MVISVGRLGVLLTLVVVLAACEDAERRPLPTAPTPPAPVAPQPAPPTATGFPPITGPGRVFVYRDTPLPRITNTTTKSRYILYDAADLRCSLRSPGGNTLVPTA
jgi:hypothetical protein